MSFTMPCVRSSPPTRKRPTRFFTFSLLPLTHASMKSKPRAAQSRAISRVSTGSDVVVSMTVLGFFAGLADKYPSVPVAHPSDIFELGTEMKTKSAASATSFGEASTARRPEP